MRICVDEIENRITFKIKKGYYLELLTSETMKLLGSTESKITKDENGENVIQKDSKVLYTFVPNKPFGSLLEISPTNHIFSLEFQKIKVECRDQNSKPLEVEDKINLNLIIR